MNVEKFFGETEVIEKQRIAVLGAGIIGINCALALQMQGYQVTLIDKADIGSGCSKGNAGHFATEQVFPLADPALLKQLPKMLLDPLGPVSLSAKHFIKALPWFMRFFINMRAKKRDENSAALKALNQDAIDYYKPLLAEIGQQGLLTCHGSLLVFEHTPYAEVAAIYKHYQQAGIAVELLDKQQALALEPNLHSNINYALFFTEVGHTIAPLRLCEVLAEHGKSLGMKMVKCAVKQLSQNKIGVTVQTSQGDYDFDRCVVAMGAYSKKIVNGLGYALPIEAERGYSYSIGLAEKETASLSRPVTSAERKFIITPMDKLLRFSGTVEYAGLRAKANHQRADMLLKNAEFILKQLPQNSYVQKADAAERWMGCRPSLPDSLPVICQAPYHPAIYFALGHQHLGLTQGAVTGKLIEQLISGKQTDIDLSPFCISRFN
ncbi:NAD(P)/FAD-dependent oxidoreductase [Thalassotalea sp. PLHSN55]|uniref:NAD(P)/FAD-dependent oxidoreductase n=1 Tax=Thalassotalea sp. PLHSN55 TaxID=3435888 RepID=UPI003F837B45